MQDIVGLSTSIIWSGFLFGCFCMASKFKCFIQWQYNIPLDRLQWQKGKNNADNEKRIYFGVADVSNS